MALERKIGKVLGSDFSKPNRFLKNPSALFSELQVSAICCNIISQSLRNSSYSCIRSNLIFESGPHIFPEMHRKQYRNSGWLPNSEIPNPKSKIRNGA
jgi:hypothetical protein